eukprot:2861048-Pyramimonas_sp.AAC.1
MGSRCAADLFGARTSGSARVALCACRLLFPAETPLSTCATAVQIRVTAVCSPICDELAPSSLLC